MRLKHNNRLVLSLDEKYIYKTLLYSDLFNYPLTGEQVFRFLGKKIKGTKFLTLLKSIPHQISGNTIYYFLPRRESLVTERTEKETYSLEKIEKTKRIAKLLSFIPTINFIGISGSLALMNAERNSDSDLFFITSTHTIWITRFLVYISLEILGVRRKKGKYNGWSICPNMFIDESHLSFSGKKRSLYLAHEILQLLPVINKGDTYQKFLQANFWIKKYFPNMVIPKKVNKKEHLPFFFFFPLEYIVRLLQLWYMRKDKTRETTSPFMIAFHPIDYETITLEEYEKRRKTYGI